MKLRLRLQPVEAQFAKSHRYGRPTAAVAKPCPLCDWLTQYPMLADWNARPELEASIASAVGAAGSES